MIRNYLVIIQTCRRIRPQNTTGPDLHATTAHWHCPLHTPVDSSSVQPRLVQCVLQPARATLSESLPALPSTALRNQLRFFLFLLHHSSFSNTFFIFSLTPLPWLVRAAIYEWGWPQGLAVWKATNPQPAGVWCVWSSCTFRSSPRYAME